MKNTNSEGYIDVTACEAIMRATIAEHKVEKDCVDTIWLIKKIANLAGFKVVGRIALEHQGTGRTFKG